MSKNSFTREEVDNIIARVVQLCMKIAYGKAPYLDFQTDVKRDVAEGGNPSYNFYSDMIGKVLTCVEGALPEGGQLNSLKSTLNVLMNKSFNDFHNVTKGCAIDIVKPRDRLVDSRVKRISDLLK